MSFETFLDRSSVVELRSTERNDAFRELVSALANSAAGIDGEVILREVLEREKLTSTRIGRSVAIPHARIESLETPCIAVGRSRGGIRYDEQSPERVHLVVLVVSDERQHLEILASIVSRLSSPGLRERLIAATDTSAIYRILDGARNGGAVDGSAADVAESEAVLEGAVAIARSVGAGVLLVHAQRPLPRLAEIASGLRVILFTAASVDAEKPPSSASSAVEHVHFPFRSVGIESRIDLSLLFARISGCLASGARVVSVMASGAGERLDRIAVGDSSGRFGDMLDNAAEAAETIDHRIFARVLQLALTLAAEGREGKPVGTIFVLGDTDRVIKHCRQLIANPFIGYAEAERNVLDPSMEESIKEFAKIDGAFIVRADGVILSAGTYITTSNISVALPRGLGSRHMAAASVTSVTDALAVALSESTRVVSLFRRGKRIAELTSPA